MAKKTVASLQKKGAKAFTKAVKLVKSNTGSYSFKAGKLDANACDGIYCKCDIKTP